MGVVLVGVGAGAEEDVDCVQTVSPQSIEEHVHPDNLLQPLHPSLLSKLPSSQASSDAITPSPQDDVHVSGVVGVPSTQLKPHSTVQVAEHPSPGSEAPSSHTSVPAFLPSPQTVLHVD